MSRRDPAILIRHMLDHAREAIALAGGRSRVDLAKTRLLELALVRLVEIVGEAASRVPPAQRAQYPGIPWEDVVGMRNRLIHGYDSVDLDVLWNTVVEDLPQLVQALEGTQPTP